MTGTGGRPAPRAAAGGGSPLPAPSRRAASSGRDALVPCASGLYMDLHAPHPSCVRAADIAAHLARLCRFTGACQGFYSVAQHSVLVGDQLPLDDNGGTLLKLRGYLHDAHEAWTGDISTPMARRLYDHHRPSVVENRLTILKADIDHAVMTAFGISWPPGEAAAGMIAAADRLAFLAEWRDLMPGEPPPGHGPHKGETVPPKPIKPLAWDRAEAMFLERLQRAAAGCGAVLP